MCPSPLRSWLKVVSSNSSVVLLPVTSRRNRRRNCHCCRSATPRNCWCPRPSTLRRNRWPSAPRRSASSAPNWPAVTTLPPRLELRSGPATSRDQELSSGLNQAGRSIGLDDHWRRRWRPIWPSPLRSWLKVVSSNSSVVLLPGTSRRDPRRNCHCCRSPTPRNCPCPGPSTLRHNR